jgi:hypothetical protein
MLFGVHRQVHHFYVGALIDTPDGCDFREAAGLSAYSDLVRMTGRDLNGEIRMLRREVIEAKEAA